LYTEIESVYAGNADSEKERKKLIE
jgi:E3 ubiquitin-protein ligase BRE1